MEVMLRLTGELSLKARRTRARFQRVLASNLRDALQSHGLEHSLVEGWSRIVVHATDDVEVPSVLSRVFGVSSLSAVEGTCPARLPDIVKTGADLFAERVRGRSYAVRARRTGDHDFRSADVMRELGAALNPGARVDLENPDVEAFVEVRDDRASFFAERLPGAGGLPVGVEGRALALLSGGFDSAVAAWMCLRRGIALDYLFCNLGGGAYRRHVLEVARSLATRWSYGTRPRIHVLDFGPVAAELRERSRPAYMQVLLKRRMYRAAARVAADSQAQAIVTGESVGQVSSQTLSNLRAIDPAAAGLVLRPLVGMDKEEIVRQARRIGTYDLSARVREYCAITPSRPATAARVEAIDREEARLDPDVLDTTLAGADSVDLRSLDDAALAAGTLFVSEVPGGARVIDTRAEEAFAEWHWPGAERRDQDDLASAFGRLPREDTYVLVCAQGLQTARIAEEMQAVGYEAYSFLGGARAMRGRTQAGSAAAPGGPS